MNMYPQSRLALTKHIEFNHDDIASPYLQCAVRVFMCQLKYNNLPHRKHQFFFNRFIGLKVAVVQYVAALGNQQQILEEKEGIPLYIFFLVNLFHVNALVFDHKCHKSYTLVIIFRNFHFIVGVLHSVSDFYSRCLF